jgi:hypothetical protein
MADVTVIVIVTVQEDVLLTNIVKNVMIWPLNSHPFTHQMNVLHATRVVKLATDLMLTIVLPAQMVLPWSMAIVILVTNHAPLVQEPLTMIVPVVQKDTCWMVVNVSFLLHLVTRAAGLALAQDQMTVLIAQKDTVWLGTTVANQLRLV